MPKIKQTAIVVRKKERPGPSNDSTIDLFYDDIDDVRNNGINKLPDHTENHIIDVHLEENVEEINIRPGVTYYYINGEPMKVEFNGSKVKIKPAN